MMKRITLILGALIIAAAVPGALIPDVVAQSSTAPSQDEALLDEIIAGDHRTEREKIPGTNFAIPRKP